MCEIRSKMYKKEKDYKSLIDKAEDQWIKSVIMRYIKKFTNAIDEINIYFFTACPSNQRSK